MREKGRKKRAGEKERKEREMKEREKSCHLPRLGGRVWVSCSSFVISARVFTREGDERERNDRHGIMLHLEREREKERDGREKEELKRRNERGRERKRKQSD